MIVVLQAESGFGCTSWHLKLQTRGTTEQEVHREGYVGQINNIFEGHVLCLVSTFRMNMSAFGGVTRVSSQL